MSPPRQLSLRRQLLLWLLLPQLVLWLAAAYLAYAMALGYSNEVIDRSLAKSSRALARQVKPFGNGFYVDFPQAAREILEEDPNDRVYYMVSSPPEAFLLGDPAMPRPPAGLPVRAGASYFYNAAMAKQGNQLGVRVAALYLNAGTPDQPQLMLVQVAKSRALSAELAHKILFDMGLPLLGLMLLTSVLVWAGISRGLSPLRNLRRSVEHRSARDLAPIEAENAPSEVRALATAINTLLAEVHGQVAQQRRFIADAAHQLRTPLAGLKSQSELAQGELRQAQPDVARACRQLEQVHTSVERSIRLVNQLLALARAEPEAGLQLAPLDLAQLVREVSAEAVPRALARDIDLGVEGGDAPLTIAGHAGLLRELVANLLDNAIQYTPMGGEVTVALQPGPGEVWLRVSDNGPGIPPAERERVFERFYRGSAEGKGKGCGLGLAIVQEIARRHRTTVTLSEHPPHGLTVSLRFALSAPSGSTR
ncbi:integral membrane sensor signal transduction histidine kinase [Pseudogulbenkiania sp. NH8B]|uniref:sensor histidine kinase n=1 Tax=Pseudogulbenkiania sp. (strain NH8B) TaxID=748280 RepID=UPI0002279863|nr:sensor histidine kinase [Pseudogulbenkiania sp. NH8B]BAK74958.1 integral membrane sensor signal transduction histidine kinase [Pseudogulbenkiania sp. NH8B]